MRFKTEFRSTSKGGYDGSVVFSESGWFISPTTQFRSRTGNRGEDVYVVKPGTYYIISFSMSDFGRWEITMNRITPQTKETLFVIDDRFSVWGKASEK
ncbi:MULTISPECIES: hypothetical protein [Metallosphaera]|nr:hypothetical protein [Metallosphaera sedula]MCH1770469.1 hypothetical protein [Metallosphaera sedula]